MSAPSGGLNREYYSELLGRFGMGPEALGWSKGNQFLRFKQLTTGWELPEKSFLDVGCGLGDFVSFLRWQKVGNFSYCGIDLMPEFVEEGRQRHEAKGVSFIEGDFLEFPFDSVFDYVIASGTFNLKRSDHAGYDYVFQNMSKMFELSRSAISMDFLTNRVDFTHKHNFNSSPEKILSMAYSLSKRVFLRNDVFPFEFSVTIIKDDSFNPATSVFSDVATSATLDDWCPS